MKRPNWSLALAISLCWVLPIAAQNVKSDPIHPQVEVTHAQYLGKTPPLRNLVPVATTSPEKREKAEQNKITVPNFVGRRGNEDYGNPGALPKNGDPVRQLDNKDNGIVVEPLVLIEGMSQADFNATPPDPCGDIGSNYYIQMINATRFRVFEKDGTPVSGPIAANTIWSQVGFTSAGDPIILFDQEADRWIITEFPNGNKLLVAVSDTNDPLGAWTAYAFSTPVFQTIPNIPFGRMRIVRRPMKAAPICWKPILSTGRNCSPVQPARPSSGSPCPGSAAALVLRSYPGRLDRDECTACRRQTHDPQTPRRCLGECVNG
ncbi:MAG: hypothetical protein IPJ40_03695 [Saprospirales bacterium]|nr:hypothetical protein [Saprospirales bacterium]